MSLMAQPVKPANHRKPHALDGLIQTSQAFQLLKPFTDSIKSHKNTKKTVISVNFRQELASLLKSLNAESIKSFNNSSTFYLFTSFLWL